MGAADACFVLPQIELTVQQALQCYIYMHVAIHALASMPSAPRLTEADSKHQQQ
jgi:hypothetical protein